MPAGPDFQDPPPVPNAPPYFVPSADPPYPETAAPIAAVATATVFTAIVHDDNIDDTLTARWVVNYPPYTPGSTTEVVPPEVVPRSAPTYNALFQLMGLTCAKFNPGADNNLVVIASDRGFIDQSSPLLTDHDHRYNYDANGNPVILMMGWRLIGCP